MNKRITDDAAKGEVYLILDLSKLYTAEFIA